MRMHGIATAIAADIVYASSEHFLVVVDALCRWTSLRVYDDFDDGVVAAFLKGKMI